MTIEYTTNRAVALRIAEAVLIAYAAQHPGIPLIIGRPEEDAFVKAIMDVCTEHHVAFAVHPNVLPSAGRAFMPLTDVGTDVGADVPGGGATE